MRVLEMHSRVGVVSRARRSATAAAAYIAREKLYDERTGLAHDYRHRDGVEFTELMLDDEAPEFVTDREAKKLQAQAGDNYGKAYERLKRERLWNAAEAREKHPRAQTARSWQFAFPYEFNEGQRKEAGRKIMLALLVRYGGAVDAAWHRPDENGDNRNFHIHLLQTTRKFENDTWAKTKDRLLDDRVKGPKEVQDFRAHVAGILNEIAARERMEIYIEHLSFKARGIEKEPTTHLGWQATSLERRGLKTERGDINREATARNQQCRQLQEDRKVIDFALAKEELQQKQGQPTRRATEEERFQAFYREAYNRRAAALQSFERRHGPQEKGLRREMARLQGEIDKGGVTGLLHTGAEWWRKLRGAETDRQKLDQASHALTGINARRKAMLDELERDRLQRLETMKRTEEQDQRVREARQQQTLARAVGNIETRAGEQQPVNDEAKARRREFFRRQATERKQALEIRQAETPTPEPPAIPAPHRTLETPTAQAFDKAATPEQKPDRDARRREFFSKRGQQRDRDRDHGPELEL